MSRAFCVPAIFFIFAAFVLLFIVSISLPYLTAMDITRVHTDGTVQVTGDQAMSQLRVSYPHQSSFGPAIDARPFATLVGYLVCRLPNPPGVLPLSVHRSYCYTALNGNMVCSETGALLFPSSSLSCRSYPTQRQRLFAFHSERRQLDHHRLLVDPWSRHPSRWYVICSAPSCLLPVLTTCCLGL